jgi:hypothetical protein
MTTYTITGPDGRDYSIDGPPGATQEQVVAQISANMPKQERSLPAQIGRDAALLTRNVISGAAALPSLVVDAGNKLLGSKKPFGTNQESVEGGLDALGFPRPENRGQAIASDVAKGVGGLSSGMGAGQVLKGIPAVAGVGKFLTAAPEAQAVSTGLSSGASSAVKEGGGSENAQLIAGIVAGLSPMAAPAAKMAALKTLQSMAGPERLAVAKAMKDRGIDLSVAQVTNSPFIKGIAAASESTPFSGAGRLAERQGKQMNTAVNRTMGQSGDNVVQGIENAKTDLGRQYDDLYKRDFRLDDTFRQDVGGVQMTGEALLDAGQQRIINNMTQKIEDLADSNGLVNGEAMLNLKQQLDELAMDTGNSVLANRAKELRAAFNSAISRFDPTRAQALRDTNKLYHNTKTLEKAVVPNSIDGDVGIAKLSNLNKLTPGQTDLKELAKGATMIKQGTIGNSGTASRLGAAVAGTGVAAGSFGASVAASQAFNRGFNQNQSIINAMVKKSPTFASLIERGAPAATVNYMLQQLSPEAREAARNGEDDDQP